MRDSLLIYTAYKNKFAKLTNAQFGELIRFLIEYQETGTVPEIEDVAVALSFDVARFDLDQNNKKYEETVEKRREAGKKGAEKTNGKSRQMPANAETEAAKVGKAENESAKTADNVNDNDNDNVTFIKSNKTNKSDFEEAIEEFKKHRRSLRKPMTDKAVELFKKRLNKLTNSEAKQIELINIAIERGWQTVYPVDEQKEKPAATRSKNRLKDLEKYYLEKVND